MTRKAHAAIVTLMLVLAGCQGEKPVAAKQGTAGGEILAGSVSDAMLPVDTVRSQPPLAPKPTASAGEPGRKAETKSGTPAAAKAAEDEPAPAETAEPAEAE